MLRLRIRIETIDGSRSIEDVGIANSGFIGLEPEILMPMDIAKKLNLHLLGEPETYMKITGDDREVSFLRYRESVNVYVLTEDRVEGPVKSSVLITSGGRYILLNDKLLSKLNISLIDFGEGIWCFRDELDRRERRSV